MKSTAIQWGILLPIAAAIGCGTQTSTEGCKTDDECPLGFTCLEGGCRCRTDDSCAEGEYCNPYGTCQERPACLGNQDCEEGEICNSADPSGGRCISATSCGSSVHCAFNYYCSPTTSRCEAGCRSSGDCQLGYVCSGGNCVEGGTTNDCNICPVSPEPDPTYCDYGEYCSSTGQCLPHADKTGLCETCDAFTECPGDMICLIDNEEAGSDYCVAKCQYDSDCPNGYAFCGKVQLVDPAMECTGTGSCSNGAPCIGDAESAQAFCGCIDDEECSTGAMCDTFFNHTCLNTGWPCSSDAECAVSCVEISLGSGSAGVCLTDVGVCGKDSGMTCQELTTTSAICREL